MASREKWVAGFGQPSLSRMGEGQWISTKVTGQCSWDLPRLMDDGTRRMISDPKQRRSQSRRAGGTSREARLPVELRLADQVVVAMMHGDNTTPAERRTCGMAVCWTRRRSSRHAFGPTGINDRVVEAGTKGSPNSADGPRRKGEPETNVRCRRLEAVLGKTRRTEFQKGCVETESRKLYPGTKLETADTDKGFLRATAPRIYSPNPHVRFERRRVETGRA